MATLTAGAVVAGLGATGAGLQLQADSTDASPQLSGYGIWSADTEPQTPADPESSRVTLGVEFSSSVDGLLQGIQFYRSSQNKGPHTGQLWTASGDLLATVSFPRTRSVGWQTAALDEPVEIDDGVEYVASYTAPKGHYADDQYGLKDPVTTKDLTAWKGVYTYGDGVPDRTWRDSNYYVDVVFSPAATDSAPATEEPTAEPSSTTSPEPTETASPEPEPGTTTSSDPTPTETTSPSPDTTADTSTSSSSGGFPNASNTGVPSGWTPTSTRSTDLRVSSSGSTVQDIRLVNADLIIDASNVTVRRVEVQGGVIRNNVNGTVIEDTSVVRAPNQVTGSDGTPAVGDGGYTARRVEINGLPEGFRVGGDSSGAGPVSISDSFVRVVAPDQCGDWHGDGLQGYDGPAVTIRNMTIDFVERSGCGGTAPFFYPRNQGNTSVDIDGLLVRGGGYSFRNGMPGPVRGLKIVDGEWGYGPIDVRCSVVTAWDAQIVTIDSAYQPTGVVRSQPCNTESGS